MQPSISPNAVCHNDCVSFETRVGSLCSELMKTKGDDPKFNDNIRTAVNGALKEAHELAHRINNKVDLGILKRSMHQLSITLKESHVVEIFKGVSGISTPTPQSASVKPLTPLDKAREKFRTPVYKEADKIHSEIEFMERLLKIYDKVSHGPSLAGYQEETLTYDEFRVLKDLVRMRHTHHAPAGGAAEMLLKRYDEGAGELIRHFEERYAHYKKQFHEKLLDTDKVIDAVKRGTATPEQLKLVVDCKLAMIEFISFEGNHIHINSFKNSNSLEFIALKKMDELSKLQSPELDQVINQTILEMHRNNQPPNKPGMRVVVEGAGPNGLLAAFNLFKSGAEIFVVNDRSERYVRNQLIGLDPKLMSQLRFFMGTKFDDLFVKENALGELYPSGGGGVNTRNLEDQLKLRFAEISSFVKEKTKGQSQLDVRFEVNMAGIVPPEGTRNKFAVQLEKPKKASADALRFEQARKDAILTALLKTAKYADSDKNPQVLEKAAAEAKAIFEKEQAAREKDEKDEPFIECDMVVCCGGANDRIRDEFLSPAAAFTATKNYRVSTWDKDNNVIGFHYLSDVDSYDTATPQKIKDHLEKQKIDELIAGADFLSADFKKLHAGLTQQILKDLGEKPSQLRMFENNTTLYEGAETPKALENFLKALMKEKEKLDAKKPDDAAKMAKIDELKREIDRRWLAAVADIFVKYREDDLIFDPLPINVGTFDVAQMACEVAANRITTPKGSVIITAMGDSRVSPHFYSGSGMSGGRLGIENASRLVAEFHKKGMVSPDELVEKLNDALNDVKKHMAKKGSAFINPLPHPERLKNLQQASVKIVKLHIDKTKGGDALKKFGYAVTADPNLGKGENKFTLKYLDKNKAEKSVVVEITENGGLSVPDRKAPFSAFSELLITLRNQ